MRKSRLIGLALGMSAVLLLALTGSGEDDLGVSGRGESTRLALLRSAEVRKELEITDEQLRQIDAIGDEAKQAKKRVESVYKDQAKTKSDNPVEKAAAEVARQAMDDEMARVSGSADERLAKILDAKQRERLRQIVLRVEGPSAFLKPELIGALNLGPDQVAAIQEILGECRDSSAISIGRCSASRSTWPS